jgi:methylmalonyl-CoA mutase N-terminal domain/subunit
MLDAARLYATVGEISGALVPAFGRYREVPVL